MKIALSMLAVLFFFSCDSSSNLHVSDEDYFVKYFGGDGNQIGVDLVVDSDGYYYLLGTTDSKTLGTQVYLVKADMKGNLVWEKSFGGVNNDEGVDLIMTTNRDLAFVSNSFASPSTLNDFFVITLNREGVIIDSAAYGVPSKDEKANSIIETNDGFLVAGSTTPDVLKGDRDLTDGLQIRFKSNLDLYPNIWRKTQGYENSDVIVRFKQNSDGTFYLFGYNNRSLPPSNSVDFNYWIRTVNADGEPRGTDLYPGSEFDPSTDEILTSVVFNNNGDYFLSGYSFNQNPQTNKLYNVRLRNSLTFRPEDYLLKDRNDLDLGTAFKDQKVSACASLDAGYYVFANQTSSGNSNWYLDKIASNGVSVWPNPVIFGGENNDTVGGISQLPDGRVIMIGTMEVGGKIPEKKMTLIKVNAAGKFAR